MYWDSPVAWDQAEKVSNGGIEPGGLKAVSLQLLFVGAITYLLGINFAYLFQSRNISFSLV